MRRKKKLKSGLRAGLRYKMATASKCEHDPLTTRIKLEIKKRNLTIQKLSDEIYDEDDKGISVERINKCLNAPFKGEKVRIAICRYLNIDYNTAINPYFYVAEERYESKLIEQKMRYSMKGRPSRELTEKYIKAFDESNNISQKDLEDFNYKAFEIGEAYDYANEPYVNAEFEKEKENDLVMLSNVYDKNPKLVRQCINDLEET